MLKKRLFRKYSRRPFTLLELMVAMGLFAIIMLMVLQFFSGAQKVWADVERKSETYGDARIAMDMMATMLQTTYPGSAELPFLVDATFNTANQQKAYSIAFPTKSELHPENTANIFYASFGLRRGTGVNAGDLLYAGFYSDAADYRIAFRTDPSNPDIDQAKTMIVNHFNSTDWSVVAKNITSLEFKPLYLDYDNSSITPSASYIGAVDTERQKKVPNLVLITMTMLNSPDYRQWAEDMGGLANPEPPEAEKFRKSREKTFTRVVYIGQYYEN